MDIGGKIKSIRLQLGLTQEELANRAELTKGFISLLERDLTSPSIATLIDILSCLGTTPKEFFDEASPDKVVYTANDVFEKDDEKNGSTVRWLITSAQKNAMEPIMLTLQPKGTSGTDNPHEGEEFGYVISGRLLLRVGSDRYSLKTGDSFYFEAKEPHELKNTGSSTARVLWVSNPPSF